MAVAARSVERAPRLIDVLPGVASAACRPPPHRAAWIPRDDLVQRLLDADASAVAITAPAGYGKTTTTVLWDEADDRPFAWVHLDPRDDDPVHLCHHIAVALDQVGPLGVDAVRTLSGPGRSVDFDLLPTLVACLEAGPPTVLVLDDIHTVTSSGSLHCIDVLLEDVPPGCTIGLLGRSAPDLPFAKRRVTGALVEVTATDLKMSGWEAAQLFHRAGVDIDTTQIDSLVQQTEGWPAGLHIAELYLRSHGTDGAPITFTGHDRRVEEFLAEEVLRDQTAEMIEFLEWSAVLDTMTAPLLDALLGRDDSAQMLRSIERSGNLFLIPLDNTHDHFRYHHLFRDLLRERLTVSNAPLAIAVEAKASAIFEAHGDIDSAVRHALRAGDEIRAADLILLHAAPLTFGGRVSRLATWLNLLGEGAMERSPSAAAAWMWFGIASGDAAVAERALTAAARFDPSMALADGSPSMGVAIAMVRAVAAPGGIPGVLRDTDTVRAGGGPTKNPWWIFATVVQGTCYSMAGDLDLARQRFDESSALSTGLPMYEAGTLAHLSLLALYDDDVAKADRLATRAVRLVDGHNLEALIFAVPVLAIGALVAARGHRFDDARALASRTQASLERLGDLSPRSIVFANLLLARTMMMLGDRAEARSLVEDAQQARQRDPTATFLNEQLDDLATVLTSGEGASALEVASLTATELRFLSYLPSNLSLQDIASELNISRNTAKSHSVAVYRKLGVSSRNEAVTAARRIGLVT